MRQTIFILIFLSIFGYGDIYSQKRKDRDKEIKSEISEKIKNGEYKLIADIAHPIILNRTVVLDGSYYLEIKNDSVFSNLPYYGRAYSLPYGGGEGLIFTSTITDYKIKEGKRNTIIASFSSQTEEDFYSFILTFYPTGGAYISVSSNQKQGISFTADFAQNEEKDIQ